MFLYTWDKLIVGIGVRWRLLNLGQFKRLVDIEEISL